MLTCSLKTWCSHFQLPLAMLISLEAAAAQLLVNTVIRFLNSSTYALQLTSCIMVGQAVGEGNLYKLRNIIQNLQTSGALLSTIHMIILSLFNHLIFAALTTNEDT